MCVIIFHQRKHKTIPIEQLQNAIHNNPHGVGLIRFGPKGTLIVEKELPEDLENGPNAQELHDRLKKLENFSYALHLRNTTAGENTEQNLHPFTLVNDKKTGQHIELMHNGTLGAFIDRQSDASDTHNFVETVAKPLAEMHVAAYPNSSFIKNNVAMRFMEMSRGNMSRFLIVTGQKDVMRLGNWTEKEFGWVSNDDYFRTVTRGPNKKNYPTGGTRSSVFSEGYAKDEPGNNYSLTFFDGKFPTYKEIKEKEFKGPYTFLSAL